MTVVAWDGTTLAADRLAINGNTRGTTRKIYKVVCPGKNGVIEKHLVGVTGLQWKGMEMLDWYKRGASPSDFPECARSSNDTASLLVIRPEGACRFEGGPVPLPILDSYTALGSGRDFALAAMHMGGTAERAVQVACDLDAYCGAGLDWMTFDDEGTRHAYP